MNNPVSKYQLRKKFKDIRATISTSYREEAAQQVVDFFKTASLFKNSMHIACYLPFKDEFDSTPLIEAIWIAKKNCYLPVLINEENKLSFIHYAYGDALHFNRYAILEPKKSGEEIAAQHLDIVIMPLLAFDLHGHRLGTGGGYYDRTFAFLHTVKQQKPVLIGLGYSLQQAQKLPAEPWDISLQGILTEKKFIYPLSL